VFPNRVHKQEAGENFHPANLSTHEPHTPSRAESLGINPPPLTDKQRYGIGVEAAIASGRAEARFAAMAKYNDEKVAYEQARDDAIMKKINARRSVTI
jgi:hypothetical protein